MQTDSPLLTAQVVLVAVDGLEQVLTRQIEPIEVFRGSGRFSVDSIPLTADNNQWGQTRLI
jgi:hypothetical protein